jgi:hypothetical protein
VQLRKDVDIGAGVRAQLVTYRNPRFDRYWTALWWEWPYRDGSNTMYERLVLFVSNAQVGRELSSPHRVGSLEGGQRDDIEAVLRTLARSVVETRVGERAQALRGTA